MNSEKRYPEPTVGALIFNPEGKLLLVKTHKWKGKYTIPGGHVELGETLVDALKREVAEETGLEVVNHEFLCYQEFIYDPSFWEQRHFIFFDFIVQANDQEVQLNDEAQEYLWVDLKDAYSYPIDAYLRYSLDIFQNR
ncbi:MAG: NUDIX domain-containing protein [Anaerolineales bacterium]